jgi:Kdo2-lipid IVA lauroyltransferase/acyltransferase
MRAPGFYVFYGFIWLFTLLPLKVQYGFSWLLFLGVYHIIRYRRIIVLTNLRKAFPEKSEKEILKIAKGFYLHMCDQLIEAFQLIHLSGKSILKRMKIKNPEVIQEYYNQNRSIALVFGHYGNWEWLACLPLAIFHKCLAIYSPLKNPYFDRMMINLRSKFGVHVVPTNRVLQEMLSSHKSGERILTLFLGDQRPAKRHVQYWTRFLNQDTGVFLGVEKISKKLNHVVVYARIQKIKRGYYELEFVPLFENPGETEPYEITEKHLAILEADIIQKPDYWLWSHRRWRSKKPAHIV